MNQDGAVRSENADISSDSPDENSGCRMFKVSPAMSIIRGLVGANPDSKRNLGDVQAVNILLLIL